MKMAARSESGMSTIELSFMMIGSMFLLLGLIDASSVLRARTALHEAARLSVRHLATSSGGAVVKMHDTRSGRYTWTRHVPGQGSSIVATGATRDMPVECNASTDGGYCEVSFESFEGGDARDVERQYREDWAEMYVAREIGMDFPRISTGQCGDEPYCLNVDVQIPGENGRPIDGDILVTVTYRVPLLLLMGGGSVAIQRSASMRPEHGVNNRIPQLDMDHISRSG
jgi:hypothetical protein